MLGRMVGKRGERGEGRWVSMCVQRLIHLLGYGVYVSLCKHVLHSAAFSLIHLGVKFTMSLALCSRSL
jgi:hypothetical protein